MEERERNVALPESRIETLASDGARRSAPTSEPTPPSTIGRYAVEGRLGAGAMGIVYVAIDPELDRRVAVKVIAGSSVATIRSVERFEREARALAKLSHPNVVQVYEVGYEGGQRFIAMELVSGRTLRAWRAQSRSWRECVAAYLQAGAGLAAAHDAGLVHRDFKPDNCNIDDQGRVRVLDFGLVSDRNDVGSDGDGSVSSDLDEVTHGEFLTKTGSVLGTLAYMPPEQLEGRRADAQSDQFSFSVSLYEALYGERPFATDSPGALLLALRRGEVPPSPKRSRVPRRVRRAILRGLAPAAADRWPSMAALLAELRKSLAPRTMQWAALALALSTGAVVVALRDEASAPCADAAGRVEAFWNTQVRRSLRVGGPDYTAAHANDATVRLQRAIDSYAARWSDAYRPSCKAVGPHGLGGTPAEKAAAQCLENRLGALRGLVELTTTTSLDAGRVDDVAGALPAIEDCASGQWVPYPADPGEAERAAALDEGIAAVDRARLADRTDGLDDAADALVADARTLGNPYRLASALQVRARLLRMAGNVDEAFVLLQEALELSVAAEHDLLAADIINDTLIVMTHARTPSWREGQHLAALARALVARSGGDDELLANLSLNLGSLLRVLERPGDAIDLDRRAEELFANAGNRRGVAKAHFNRLVSLARLGRFDQAERELDAVIERLDEAFGEASTAAVTGRRLVVTALNLYGRPREASARSRDLYRMVSDHYTPASATYRDIAYLHVTTNLNTGDVDVAEDVLREVVERRGTGGRDELDQRIFAARIASARRDYESAASLLEDAARLTSDVGNEAERAWLLVARVRLELIEGRVESVCRSFADLTTWSSLGELRRDESLRVEAALVAVLAECPIPPHAASWGVVLQATDATRPPEQLMLGVIGAVASRRDASTSVARAQAQLAAMYSADDENVRVLGAWLERQR